MSLFISIYVSLKHVVICIKSHGCTLPSVSNLTQTQLTKCFRKSQYVTY